MSAYTNTLWHGAHGLCMYNVSKTYISGTISGTSNMVSGVASFRPIFEFNQE